MDKQAEIKEEVKKELLLDDDLLGSYFDRASPLGEKVSVEGLREVAKDQIKQLLKAGYIKVSPIPDLEGAIRKIIPCPDIDTKNCEKYPDCDRCSLLDQTVHQVTSLVSQYRHQLAGKMEVISDEEIMKGYCSYEECHDHIHGCELTCQGYQNILKYRKPYYLAQLQADKKIVEG